MIPTGDMLRMLALCLIQDLRRDSADGEGPLAGHSYVAAEALYHALDRERHVITPFQATVDGISHWWVEVDGIRVDVTAAQFHDPRPWYRAGKPRAFLTADPLSRTISVLDNLETLCIKFERGRLS